MWIKVCANTTLEDAQLAIEAGASAVGFIFAGGPRNMTAEAVRRITAELPASVETYGVFATLDFDQIVATVADSGIGGIQLHGGGPLAETIALANRLRQHYTEHPLPERRLGLLHVLHYSADLADGLARLTATHAVDAALIDSRTATRLGGTGLSFDWKAARGSFLAAAPQLRIIAAGGLRPENVAEAILTLEPWGVDVASGVEASPGKKDPTKVREFLARAKEAAAQLKQAQSHLDL